MQVTINVDETQLKEIMEEQLKALDPEALQEIFVQAVGEYFRQNNYKNLEQVLFTSSGYYGSDKHLTPTVEKALANADYSKLQDIVDACIDLLKTNYTDLLISALSTLLVSGLTSSYELQSAMQTAALRYTNELRQDIQEHRI